MSNLHSNTASLRKLISVVLLLALLTFLLSMYFLKYVPWQKSDFNRRAFLELSQIEKAVQERNRGNVDVIRSTINRNNLSYDSLLKTQLNSYFRLNTINNKDFHPLADSVKRPFALNPDKGNIRFTRIGFEQQDPLEGWLLSYVLEMKGSQKIALASKPIDSLMQPIVSTYKDIFADYLLILDTNTSIIPQEPGPLNSYNHKGRVIFNSGHLSVDNLLDLDTLLKKTDGFSLLNIHDVRIEGNPYKLFLYPIDLCNQRVILAGLISQPAYQEASESVPVNLVTIGGILVLLLLLNLPLLKIYIIGPRERITGLDIRMVVLTYFLAAFVLFFLFSLFFLSRAQTAQNHRNLQNISDSISHNYFTEIETVCRQLDEYDTLYAALHSNKDSVNRQFFVPPSSSVQILPSQNGNPLPVSDPLKLLYDSANDHLWCALRTELDLLTETIPKSGAPSCPIPSILPGYTAKDSSLMNAILHPYIYPQMENVFWLNKEGDWAARWGFRKFYQQTRQLNVSDRPYFKDILNHNMQSLSPGDNSYPSSHNYTFSIWPSLSKVTGVYNINIVRESRNQSLMQSPENNKTADLSSPLIAIGISSYMYSVQNTILPVGYAFSIVNNEGEILFDSKPGRSLLTNFFIETGDNTDIRQCVRYRYKRYFQDFSLRGKNVALISTPLSNSPFTLLVYYTLSITDEFKFHTLGLVCSCMGAVLLLIGLTAFIREWSGKKPGLSGISSVNFEWLRPNPWKMDYYRHLISWMGWLTGLLALGWLINERFSPGSENGLFITTLSFPFYIAIHYFIIRHKYYLLKDNAVISEADHCKVIWPLPTPPEKLGQRIWNLLRILSQPMYLPLYIVIITIFMYAATGNDGLDTGDILFALFIQISFISVILLSYHRFKCLKRKNDTDLGILLNKYVWTILFGMSLISMVPALGIFTLFYKEENNSLAKMEKLNLARSIQNRLPDIDKRLSETGLDTIHYGNDLTFLENARFNYGIYAPSGAPVNAHPVFINTAAADSRKEDTHPAHSGIIAGHQADSLQTGSHRADSLRFDSLLITRTPLRPFSRYTELHDLLFPQDSISSEPAGKLGHAGDSSWYFYNAASKSNNSQAIPALYYQVGYVASDRIAFSWPLHPATQLPAIAVFWTQISSMDMLSIYLLLLAAFVVIFTSFCLTRSLAAHIFLLELLHRYKPVSDKASISREIPGYDQFILPQEQKLQLTYPDETIILEVQTSLENFYDSMWASLRTEEKYILYDFAIDSFTNYKAGGILYKLLNKGFLRIDDEFRLKIMSSGFHNYLIAKDIFNRQTLDQTDKDVFLYMKNARRKGSWQAFRIPLHVLLVTAGLFIFLTQDDLSRKLIGLFTSIPSLAQMFVSLFDKNNGKKPSADDNASPG